MRGRRMRRDWMRCDRLGDVARVAQVRAAHRVERVARRSRAGRRRIARRDDAVGVVMRSGGGGGGRGGVITAVAGHAGGATVGKLGVVRGGGRGGRTEDGRYSIGGRATVVSLAGEGGVIGG